MQSIYKITNGRVVLPDRIIENGTVLFSNGKIIEVAAGNIEVDAVNIIDAQGKYISPGFIDLHVHGGGGHDFMDATPAAFLAIAKTHSMFGTTCLFPTTLTSSKEKLLEVIGAYEAAGSMEQEGADMPGLHLEGPYISITQKGAQDERFIRNPKEEEYEEIIERTNKIQRWSAAPELPGGLQFGRYITSKGILAALAHSDADYDKTVAAFEAGYRHITHLYSAMTGVKRVNSNRVAGAVEASYLLDHMTVELIADGTHLPKALLQLACKIKGADRIALITDAIRAAGTSMKECVLGDLDSGIQVIIEDDVAKMPDRSCFAGSVATTNKLVQVMYGLAHIPLQDTIQMLTATPAKISGIDRYKGSLTRGKDADITLFDEHLNVHYTFVKGKLVYDRTHAALPQ